MSGGARDQISRAGAIFRQRVGNAWLGRNLRRAIAKKPRVNVRALERRHKRLVRDCQKFMRGLVGNIAVAIFGKNG
jgi:hypothetical protein